MNRGSAPLKATAPRSTSTRIDLNHYEVNAFAVSKQLLDDYRRALDSKQPECVMFVALRAILSLKCCEDHIDELNGQLLEREEGIWE